MPRRRARCEEAATPAAKTATVSATCHATGARRHRPEEQQADGGARGVRARAASSRIRGRSRSAWRRDARSWPRVARWACSPRDHSARDGGARRGAQRARSRPSGSRGATRTVSECTTRTRPAPPPSGCTCLRRVTCTSTWPLGARAAVERRHLRRLAHVLGAGAALGIAQDDVRPGAVARVQPQVLGSRDLERQAWFSRAPRPTSIITPRAVRNFRGPPSSGRSSRAAGAPGRSARLRAAWRRSSLSRASGGGRPRSFQALPDLPAGARDAAGLLEQAVGVRGIDSARVDAHAQRPRGIVGVGDLDLLGAGRERRRATRAGPPPAGAAAPRPRGRRGPPPGGARAARDAWRIRARPRVPTGAAPRTRPRAAAPPGRGPRPRSRSASPRNPAHAAVPGRARPAPRAPRRRTDERSAAGCRTQGAGSESAARIASHSCGACATRAASDGPSSGHSSSSEATGRSPAASRATRSPVSARHVRSGRARAGATRERLRTRPRARPRPRASRSPDARAAAPAWPGQLRPGARARLRCGGWRRRARPTRACRSAAAPAARRRRALPTARARSGSTSARSRQVEPAVSRPVSSQRVARSKPSSSALRARPRERGGRGARYATERSRRSGRRA